MIPGTLGLQLRHRLLRPSLCVLYLCISPLRTPVIGLGSTLIQYSLILICILITSAKTYF